MNPLYDFTAVWTEGERKTAAGLLAEASGCLAVIGKYHPQFQSAVELADKIRVALAVDPELRRRTLEAAGLTEDQ
jgi:hypothetical protein